MTSPSDSSGDKSAPLRRPRSTSMGTRCQRERKFPTPRHSVALGGVDEAGPELVA